MTGDPDADEATDREDDDLDNNNSMSATALGSDSDDSSQAGYSSECGTSSSANQELASSHSNNTINNNTLATAQDSSRNLSATVSGLTHSQSSTSTKSRPNDTAHASHTVIMAS